MPEYDSMEEDPEGEGPPSQVRKAYTIRHKGEVVHAVDRMVLAKTHSIASACRLYDIQPFNY